MQYQIVELPPRQAVCLRHVGPYAEAGQAWGQLLAWAGPAGVIDEETLFLGVSHDDPMTTPPQALRYDACLSGDDLPAPPPPLTARTLPGGTYATAVHCGPHERLAETYGAIMAALAADGRVLRDAPCLENYLNDPATTPPEDLRTEIYVAV